MTTPDERPEFIQEADGTWFLLVRALPGAKKTEFAGVQEGRLRIRLHAPAVENKANKELISFVAKALGVRPSRICLTSGDTGRQKRLRIDAKTEPDWSLLLTEEGIKNINTAGPPALKPNGGTPWSREN